MYKLKLMFEWGGGTIWCDNDAARKVYDAGAIEGKLPLSQNVLDELKSLSRIHDGALDWNNPCGSSPWAEEEFERFERNALNALSKIKGELGGEYEIRYESVGAPNI